MFSHSPQMVLVVDDDEQVLRLVSMVLGRAGYPCVTALTGAQGLVRFRAESPAVVITDLNMPIGNGATLIDAIRRLSRVPVIVVSGFANDYKYRLPFSDDVLVMKKPFDLQLLLKNVRARCSPCWPGRMQRSTGRGPLPHAA
jgi:DNA-binding response OmpR family regulator